MPKVTVIIPVYGVEKYIERCARSLFEQTLDDMEFIFVDDCSPDRSIEILESILEEYPVRQPQTQIIRLPKNGGLPNARKTGIERATGEYIIHCDSDDWVDVTMYEKLYNKAIEEDADMVVCDQYQSDGVQHVVQTPREVPIERDTLFRLLICRQRSLAVRNKLLRKSCYNNDIWYPIKNNGEDICLVLQLFYYCQKISFVSEPLYYYYFNQDSLSHKEGYDFIEERSNQNIANLSIVLEFFKRNGIFEKYEQELLILKFDIKSYLMPNTNTFRGLYLWYRIYPELTIMRVLSFKRVSLYRKLLYVLASLGLYSNLRRIKRIIVRI